MIIDVTNMFNYQIVCNEQFIVGMVHSYSPNLLSNNLINGSINLNRRFGNGIIVRAQLVEE